MKNINTMQKSGGFTLIELIAVIVILGVLAATAVPKFIDLSGAAKESSVKGLAGSLSSASSVNFASYSACNAGLTGASTSAIVETQGSCVTASNAFVTVDSTLYTISGTWSDTVGTANTCSVSDGTNSSSFTMYAIVAPASC